MEQLLRDSKNAQNRLEEVTNKKSLVYSMCLKNLKSILSEILNGSMTIDPDIKDTQVLSECHRYLSSLRNRGEALSRGSSKQFGAWLADSSEGIKKILDALNKGEIGVQINKPKLKSNDVPEKKKFWSGVNDDMTFLKQKKKKAPMSHLAVPKVREMFLTEIEGSMKERNISEPSVLEQEKVSFWENVCDSNPTRKIKATDSLMRDNLSSSKEMAHFWENHSNTIPSETKKEIKLQPCERERLTGIALSWKDKVDEENSNPSSNLNKCRRLIDPNTVSGKRNLWNHFIELEAKDQIGGQKYPLREATLENTSEVEAVCEIIYDLGEVYEDDTAAVSAEVLFREYDRDYIMKILETAKNYGVVYFDDVDDEDDDAIILQKPITQMRKAFADMRRRISVDDLKLV